MYSYFIMIAIALATTPNTKTNELENDQYNKVVAQQLNELFEKLDAIESKLIRIEDMLFDLKHNVDNLDTRRKSPRHKRFPGSASNAESLEDIELPPNATTDEIVEYIKNIMETARNQRMFSDRDEQVQMLTKLGPEYVELLLSFLQGGHFSGQYHIMSAVKRLAGDEHKELILDSLQQHSDLVDIVVRRGWEEDAKEILLEKLASKPSYLPPEWIRAVVHLEDSATYDDLINFFIHGTNKNSTFEMIQNIKDIDLVDAVAKAWSRSKYGNSWDSNAMAIIALGYGHLDALQYAIDCVANQKVEQYQAERMQKALRQYTPYKGSIKVIIEWYQDNKDNIYFDQKRKIFTTE